MLAVPTYHSLYLKGLVDGHARQGVVERATYAACGARQPDGSIACSPLLDSILGESPST